MKRLIDLYNYVLSFGKNIRPKKSYIHYTFKRESGQRNKYTPKFCGDDNLLKNKQNDNNWTTEKDSELIQWMNDNCDDDAVLNKSLIETCKGSTQFNEFESKLLHKKLALQFVMYLLFFFCVLSHACKCWFVCIIQGMETS